MNKQGKNGIEWCDFTWNPIGGCFHACQWTMPDGSQAQCYAKSVAEGVAKTAYYDGFETHYWNPERLAEPFSVKTPARIFLDSMSDLMGRWVPEEQINLVLDVVAGAHWHTFQLLTKNAPRLLRFRLPRNLWAGVSMPPSSMWGKPLTPDQQAAYLHRALDILLRVDAPVRWWSFEPLSFDVAPILKQWMDRQECWKLPVQWAVIGAASNGKTLYQPRPGWVAGLLALLDAQAIPVFFKGNLDWWPWREEFPAGERLVQGRLF